MEISEYKNIFENESSHFFYVANHKIILELVKKYFTKKGKKGRQILDAGCGTGMLAKKLSRFGQVIGVDISGEALKFARKRKVKTKKASVTKLPFKDNFFDLVVCIDVLYHKQVKDSQALNELFRVLKPDGIAIFRVPANSWLRRSSDVYVHTRVRYDINNLKYKLEKAGFCLEKISFINMLLLPPAILSYFLEKIRGPQNVSSPIIKLPKLLNGLVTLLLSFEATLINIKRVNLPFGLGLIAIARKNPF